MAGRPRKPTDMKIVYGTFRKDRSTENEPRPEKILEVPRPPSYLSKYAKKFWKHLAAELVGKNVLTIVDLPALEAASELYNTYRSCQEAIYRPVDPDTGKRWKRTLAEYMSGKNSQTMPEYAGMMKSFLTLKAYLIEFGLTPAARGRLDIPKEGEKEEDTMERLYHEA